VGSDRVLDSFPIEQLLVERLDGPSTLLDFIELLGVSTVGPFHSAIEFGTFRGQDEQPDAMLRPERLG